MTIQHCSLHLSISSSSEERTRSGLWKPYPWVPKTLLQIQVETKNYLTVSTGDYVQRYTMNHTINSELAIFFIECFVGKLHTHVWWNWRILSAISSAVELAEICRFYQTSVVGFRTATAVNCMNIPIANCDTYRICCNHWFHTFDHSFHTFVMSHKCWPGRNCINHLYLIYTCVQVHLQLIRFYFCGLNFDKCLSWWTVWK